LGVLAHRLFAKWVSCRRRHNVHLLRNTFRYASKKDWSPIAKDLKPVYTAPSEQAALEALLAFTEKWDKRYPAIIKLWENAWAGSPGTLPCRGPLRTGAVDIVRHAQRLTAVPRLHALLGGLHLSGAYFAPSIARTVEALIALVPDLLVPAHCTGWQAQHTLAAALPDSWVQGSSGTCYRLSAD
jgi:Transposase, Mutator family